MEVAHHGVEVFDRAADVGGVEAQRLLQLAQHADEVDDEADPLLDTFGIDVGAVDARDGLQQHVVPHRLVEIHGSRAPGRRSRSAACR